MIGTHTARLVHTSDLDWETRGAARQLVFKGFDGNVSEDDWEHCLGGMHALVWYHGALIAHAAVVQRRLLHGDRVLRTGYVEGVVVDNDWRRYGLGKALMDAVEQVLRGAYELGALSVGHEVAPFYIARGWAPWTGPTQAMTANGIAARGSGAGFPQAGDDGVHVLPISVELDVNSPLTCDWRNGALW